MTTKRDEVELTYRWRVEGRELFVYDEFLSDGETAELHDVLQFAPYQRTESDNPERKDIKQWVLEIDPEMGIVPRIEGLLARDFPDTRFDEPYRSYVNGSTYGDVNYNHQDCPDDKRHVTALIYVNAVWKPEWGGETIFSNQRPDAVALVAPRPGRLALFRGAIIHRASPPSRDCHALRLTLAIKFPARD